MPRIDLEAAKDHKVVLCGTQWGRDPTAPLTMGLILELTRNIGRENARMHAGEPLQKFVGIEIEGKTLGVVGLGKLGSQGFETGAGVRHERDRLEPEPDAGAMQGSRRQLRQQGGIVRDRRHRHHPCGAEPALARAGGSGRSGAHEADRLSSSTPRAGRSSTKPRCCKPCSRRRSRAPAVDVFSVEPLPVDHPFRKLDNIVLTPHLGYVTEESFRNHYSQMVEGIDAWFKGEPVRRLA